MLGYTSMLKMTNPQGVLEWLPWLLYREGKETVVIVVYILYIVHLARGFVSALSLLPKQTLTEQLQATTTHPISIHGPISHSLLFQLFDLEAL